MSLDWRWLAVSLVVGAMALLTASASIRSVRWRELVSVFAVGLSGEYSRWSRSPQHVVAVSGEDEVCGIAALGVIAYDVVEDWNVSAYSSRHWRNEPCIHDAVSRFCSTKQVASSVAALIGATSPEPAFGGSVNRNTGEEASELFSVEMRNGEILGVSHRSASFADWWLEPLAMSPHRGGSFYFITRSHAVA